MTENELFWEGDSKSPIKDQFGEPVKYYGRELEIGESLTILGIEYVVLDAIGDSDGWSGGYIVEKKVVKND